MLKLFNNSVEFEAKRIHLKQESLKSNCTHKLRFYADDVSILGGIVPAIEKNTNTWIAANKETGLKFNAGETKYIFMSQNREARRCHNIEIDNSTFNRVEDFKYLVTNLSYQNNIKK